MAAAEALSKLIQDLKVSLKALNDEGVAKELQVALHGSKQLPDKATAALAAEAVDLMGELDLLLEPGHMILADHFLGVSLSPTWRLLRDRS